MFAIRQFVFLLFLTAISTTALGNIGFGYLIILPWVALSYFILIVFVESTIIFWVFRSTFAEILVGVFVANLVSGLVGIVLLGLWDVWLIDIAGVSTLRGVVAVMIIGSGVVNTIIEAPILMMRFKVGLIPKRVLTILVANFVTAGVTAGVMTYFNLPLGYGLVDPSETPLSSAIRSGNERFVRVLVDNGAELEEEQILYYAIRDGFSFKTIKFLIANGANVNEGPVHDKKPLWTAVSTGRGADIVKLLIENGADISDYRIITEAKYLGDYQVYRTLKNFGAADPVPDLILTKEVAECVKKHRNYDVSWGSRTAECYVEIGDKENAKKWHDEVYKK